MSEISKLHRKIGRYVQSEFGADVKVTRYGDDTEKYSIPIVKGYGVPQIGVISYGTVGLSDIEQIAGEARVNVEILGVCGLKNEEFANVLSSCYFECVKNGTPIIYGGYIENIVGQYNISSTLNHITFITPFLWRGFNAQEFDEKVVHWLMAIPISDSELEFLMSNGINALEDLFEKKQIDLFNINRPSTL